MVRRRVSYANITATAALLIALGGSAYAATALPRNSVGRTQLRKHAVTTDKLAKRAVRTRTIARNAVRLDRLSAGVRSRLRKKAARGPAGSPGPKGDTGPPGPAGAGAGRINFDVAAVPTPTRATVLDMPGLKLSAACTLSGGDVALELFATAAEDATLQASFSVDNGTDPANPGAAQTGNNQITLAAGTETSLGGPGTGGGSSYARVVATGILAGASRTITLELFELINADTGRCRIAGTALPAT